MDEEQIKKLRSEEPFSERVSVLVQSKKVHRESEPVLQITMLVAAQLQRSPAASFEQRLLEGASEWFVDEAEVNRVTIVGPPMPNAPSGHTASECVSHMTREPTAPVREQPCGVIDVRVVADGRSTRDPVSLDEAARHMLRAVHAEVGIP